MNIDVDDLDPRADSEANLIPVLRCPQLQESSRDKWTFPPGAMMDSFPNEDINFEDGFTFTGLLQGDFDPFYTPYLSDKQVPLSRDANRSKTYSGEMFEASSSKASSSKKIKGSPMQLTKQRNILSTITVVVDVPKMQVLFTDHGVISRTNNENCEKTWVVATITDGNNNVYRDLL